MTMLMATIITPSTPIYPFTQQMKIKSIPASNFQLAGLFYIVSGEILKLRHHNCLQLLWLLYCKSLIILFALSLRSNTHNTLRSSHLMVAIPFGVSYFPVGWKSSASAASALGDDVSISDGGFVLDGPFPIPGKEALGIRMFLFSTIIGQLTVSHSLYCS